MKNNFGHALLLTILFGTNLVYAEATQSIELRCGSPESFVIVARADSQNKFKFGKQALLTTTPEGNSYVLKWISFQEGVRTALTEYAIEEGGTVAISEQFGTGSGGGGGRGGRGGDFFETTYVKWKSADGNSKFAFCFKNYSL